MTGEIGSIDYMDLPAHGYQHAGYLFAKRHPKCALFVDMGLGKTRIAGARAADAIYSFDGISKVLIVGPKRVVENSWPEELQKWRYTRGLRFLILNGTQKEIHRKLDQPGIDIHLVSYDRVHLILQKARYPEYGLVILDESQKVRNPSTRRYQAVELITADAEQIIELTGTPAPNGLHQLWSQIKLLDGGQRLGKTQRAFTQRWFSMNEHSGKLQVNAGEAADQIHKAIRGICFTLLSEDYQKLPPLIVNDVNIELPPTIMERYNKFEEESVLELFDGEDITAVNATVLYSKLTQFSNGSVYDSEKVSHHIHDEKLDALEDIIDEAFGNNVFVVYQHIEDRIRIKKKYPHAVHIHTNESIEAWKRGEIELAMGHPASIGEGLNLQTGGHILVWFGVTWNLEHYLQTIKRFWRQGQTRPVMMHRLICKNTIDEIIVRSIKRKDKVQYNMLSAMKHRIEDILKR